MLKLNASFNKKVPAESEYSSRGYSASIELEIPDGLTQEHLQQKIHTTFELVRSSVEAEISGTAKALPATTEQPKPQTQAIPQKQFNKQSNEPASPKQVKYLTDIARKLNISLVGHLQNYGCNDVSQLNRQDCSALIKNIQNYAAA